MDRTMPTVLAITVWLWNTLSLGRPFYTMGLETARSTRRLRRQTGSTAAEGRAPASALRNSWLTRLRAGYRGHSDSRRDSRPALRS
jgi:hypothetical protein